MPAKQLCITIRASRVDEAPLAANPYISGTNKESSLRNDINSSGIYLTHLLDLLFRLKIFASLICARTRMHRARVGFAISQLLQ